MVFRVIFFMLMNLVFLLDGNALAIAPPKDPIFRIETDGHLGSIHSAATDSLGKIVATASSDKTVRIWESGSGKLLQTLRVPIGDDDEGALFAVAVSPDGALIATAGKTGGSWDETFSVYLFDRQSGRMIKRIPGIRYVIRALVFSPDSRQLAVASGNKSGELVFVDLASYQILESHNFSFSVEGVDWALDGQIAAVTRGRQLLLWSSSSDKQYRTVQLSGDDDPKTVRFKPDGTKLAIGFDGALQVQLVEIKGLVVRVLEPNRKIKKSLKLNSVAWSRDGSVLYAAGQPGTEKNKTVFLWDGGGLGSMSHFNIPARTQVIAIVPTAQSRLFFALNHFGVLETDENGVIHFIHKIAKAEHQYNHDFFATSADGALTRFSFTPHAQDSAVFDISSRFFVKGSKVNTDELVHLPTRTTELIDLQNWNGWGREDVVPRLNRRPLRFFMNSRYKPLSFGIAPDGNSFFIGATGMLLKFDTLGKVVWRQDMSNGILALALSKNGRYVIGGMTDGTIRWFLQSDGTEQLAFFPHPDRKRWVAWTPEGYFDASPGAENLIGYHINQGKDKEAKFVPMVYLYDVFYRPDIIQARFKGEDIKELVSLTAEEALKLPPPDIRFTKVPSTTSASSVTLCYQIKNTGGGIGELRLFQNGKLIRSDGYYRELAKKEQVGKKQLVSFNSRALYSDMRTLAVRDKRTNSAAVTRPKGDQVDECVDIETIAGENEISLAAFNASNTVQSFMNTISFASSRSPQAPHLYIIAVGIDRYRDHTINLKYAAKDARDFIAKLPQKARTLYDPQHIHLISLNDEKATKQQIVQTINELAGKVKHGDGFIFFNASHGVLLQNQYYIVTADFNGNLESGEGLISSNEVVEISKKIKSLSQLFIFDTCHAGGVDNIVSGLYDARMSVLAKKMGLHIYASAGSVQTAMDGYNDNGLYTYTLLRGIENGREADRERDGYVTVRDLGLYTKEKTSELSAQIGHPQTPVIINFGRDNPLFMVR